MTLSASEAKRLLACIQDSPYGGRTSPKYHYTGERGYLEMLWDIVQFGCDTPDRTGVGRRKLFGITQRFDLRQSFPMATVRSAPARIAFEEFWGFLNGRVDIHTYLSEKGITIWEGNTSREFLDSRGLSYLPIGHMGKAYGFQYRNFNGTYDSNFMPVGGIDQIRRIYVELKNNAFSSRMIASIWNPEQEHEMALPPCWWSHQFLVTLDEQGRKVLSLQVSSRSNDVLFGNNFNTMEFGIYLAAMAHATGMIAGELMPVLVDAHVYGSLADLGRSSEQNDPASQMKYTAETLIRSIDETPTQLVITKDINSFEDFLSLRFEDLQFTGAIVNKAPYTEKRPSMAV